MAHAKRTIERLLLVIDESAGAKQAVEYTGAMLRHRRGLLVHLFYLLSPLPSELLEFGGAEDPRQEQRLEAELRRDQQEWIASAKASARPALDGAAKALQSAGVAERNIVYNFSYPTEPKDAARTILEYAKSKHCHTVVLGHKTHSWFQRFAGADLTEQVLRYASGISVWVVQ